MKAFYCVYLFSLCAGCHERVCVWTDLQENRQVFTRLQLCAGLTAQLVKSQVSLHQAGLMEEKHFAAVLPREPNSDGVRGKHSQPLTIWTPPAELQQTDYQQVSCALSPSHIWTCPDMLGHVQQNVRFTFKTLFLFIFIPEI